MRVTYEQTLEDIAAFNLHHFRTSPLAKRRLRLTQLSSVFLTFIVVMVWPRWSSTERVVFFITLSLFWIVGFPFYYRWAIKRNAKKIYAASKSKGILGEHQLTVEPNGIATWSPANESKIAWYGVERIESDDQYIYIYTSPLQAHVIPKRAFSSVEEAKSFLEAAQTYRSAAVAGT
jgi:hypothetical protein